MRSIGYFSPLIPSSSSMSWSPHLMRKWMRYENWKSYCYLTHQKCIKLCWSPLCCSIVLLSAQVLQLRISRKAHLDLSGELPSFLENTTHIRRDLNWRVLPVPPRLQRRHVDIGDLAPCDTERFIKALQSPAQGIQVPQSITHNCMWVHY